MKVTVNNMYKDYLKYYNLENYILTDVRESFNRNGYLSAYDFFCIIIWKAKRAKTKIAQRLLNYNPDLEQGVKNLTSRIFTAMGEKQKLKILISEYKFKLPMSSAILSMLYPNQFTVYDVRVCETFTDFKRLGNVSNFDKLWAGYQEYIQCIKEYEPHNLDLRDKDRFFWGKSFYQQLNSDLKNNFRK